MSNKINISRRSLLGTATAAVAAEAGLKVLTSPMLGNSSGAKMLQKAIYDGDGKALADDSFPVPTNPIFIFTVHAKWESAGWLARPNPASVGIIGNPLIAPSTAFAMHSLTKQFGDYVAPLEGKVGFSIVPCGTTSGNHVYDGLRATMDKTGCLPSFVNEKLLSLMALNYASVGTADGATAVFGKGGTQLLTYSTLDSSVGSIMGALNPLKNLNPNAQKVLSGLNDRVTKNKNFRAGLENLANRLDAAKDPLNAALAKSKATPMTLNAANQMTDAVLASNNPLLSQIDSAVALMKLGLTPVATISIANSDPNAGGNHDNRGGNNTAFGGRSPNEVKSCVAQALTYIYSQFPGAICSIVSDGGRNGGVAVAGAIQNAGGGDTQNFEAFITGPIEIINSTFVNAASRDDTAKFGSNPQPVTLSNGTSMAPNESHVMSTVAKAIGIDLGYPYIPAVLKAG